MNWLVLFFAGALLCNAVPHLVAGLQGRRFFTPWRPPGGEAMASPTENFAWGALNLFTGAALARYAYAQNVPHGAIALALGFILAGLALSRRFGAALDGNKLDQ
ncbi:MAG: hypothetical protein KGM49_03310 [Sphingomonadales bacterium]|nr:hypothetical protein [Sphingomonadales bacterium]